MTFPLSVAAAVAFAVGAGSVVAGVMVLVSAIEITVTAVGVTYPLVLGVRLAFVRNR